MGLIGEAEPCINLSSVTFRAPFMKKNRYNMAIEKGEYGANESQDKGVDVLRSEVVPNRGCASGQLAETHHNPRECGCSGEQPYVLSTFESHRLAYIFFCINATAGRVVPTGRDG